MLLAGGTVVRVVLGVGRWDWDGWVLGRMEWKGVCVMNNSVTEFNTPKWYEGDSRSLCRLQSLVSDFLFNTYTLDN